MGHERTTRSGFRGTGRIRRRTGLHSGLPALALAISLAVPGSAVAGPAGAAPVRAAAGAPSPAEQWNILRPKLEGIKGTWTNQSYTGSVSRTMPDTALLGNGDVGVTSGGSTGVKSFYVSKGDFWAGNPTTRSAPIGGVTLQSTTAQDNPDLALGATATAGSTTDSFTASRAVNGQWGSGYEGWVSAIGKPQWIALDLGSVKTIARFVVRNDNAARPGNEAFNTKNMTFQTSADGTTWNTVDTVTNNTADVIDRTVTAVRTRHVRLHITEPTQNTTPDSTNNPRARIGQISLYASAGGTTPPAQPFREEQHIVDGSITTSVSMGDTPLSMRTWLAAEKNVLVTSVTSTGSRPVRLQASTFAGAMGSPNPQYGNASGVDGQVMWAERATPSGPNWVSRAALASTVLGATAVQPPTSSGPTAKTVFTVPAGGTVTLVTAVTGGGRNPAAPHDDAVARVRAENAGSIGTLDSQRVAWWKNFWMRSAVSLNDAALERYYYPAQYFIGASSRAGRTAPGIFGIWTTTDDPMWDGDLHLNYNAQAPFYGVYSSNRPDLALPFHEAILSYVPEAQRRARQDLRRVHQEYVTSRFPSGGVPSGVLFPVGISPFGSASGSTTDDQYHQQVSNSLFSATQFVAYYEYTQDEDFLRTKGYPFLSQVARFFEHWVERDAAGAYSLWGGPHEGTWGKNSSPDLGMLKQVLAAAVSGSRKLNVDADRRAVWENILGNLPAQPTTTLNGRTVYSLASGMQGTDTRLIRPGDNTINLEFIQPADQLGVNSDAGRLQVARDTVTAMNSWGQENSFPKIFNQAARVGYPADQLIGAFTSVISTRTAPNLRITDPHHGIEKSGATEAINSMLVQSDASVISLFPVWPAAKDASFYQLRQKGAFVVSSAKAAGTVQYVDVRSEAGGTLRVKNPWSAAFTVTDAAGNAVPYTTAGGVITVQTAAGQTYRLNPA
ncbi:glycosyl hydrolase family 95 catalytic domain-containing protein [Streptomyces sp. NPDC093099]|uniref:glycosyl hydrolase family 95 catalytic domain-containing protein n=1 Tax=Streptomyces sp. NPDC093099 TaxID=3366028 RepID=UPI0037FE12DF